MKIIKKSCVLLIYLFIFDLGSDSAFAQQYLSEAKGNGSTYTLKEITYASATITEEFEKEGNKNQDADPLLRVYPNTYDKNATLLLHLKHQVHIAQLSVVDMLGNVVEIPLEGQLKSGFYEISMLSAHEAKGVFIVRLVMDGKIYSKRMIR